ncbi:MAG: hypothetical protein GX087_10980 [Desulfobulbaceae bacterium]|nr:hypothetical protein [Desulfobulbaceae bacterium]
MLTKIAKKERTTKSAPSSSSRFFASLAAILLLSASLLAGGAAVALADNPANLQLVWARTAGEQTPIYAEQSTSSTIIARYGSKYVLTIAGMEENAGQRWYEVVWPYTGWLKTEDAWFVSGEYDPASLPLVERLILRLHVNLGNYPEASEALFGKAQTVKYSLEDPGLGQVVCQTLTWNGLIIRYENSYKDPKSAWIAKVSVGPGSRVAFGPVTVGAPASSLQALDPSFDAQHGEELILEDRLQRFRFTVQEGKVHSMSYASGADSTFLDLP